MAVLAVTLLMGACSSSGTGPIATTTPRPPASTTSATQPTTTAARPAPTTTSLQPDDVVGLVEPCVGEFVGTYSGDVSGGVSAELGEDGAITIALVGEGDDPLLRITAPMKGDPPAFTATGSAGTIDGTLDIDTCTAIGSWKVGTTRGAWQMGAAPIEVRLESADCAGGVYMGEGSVTITLGGSPITIPSPFGGGGDDGLTIGPLTIGESGLSVGGETLLGIGDRGATILGIDIVLTESGIEIGDADVVFDGNSIAVDGRAPVDLDTLCLSSTVAGHVLTTLGEIVDGRIEVRVGTGFTTYGLQAEVLFDFGSDELTADAAGTIDQVAASIAGRFPGAPITVIGHTDSIGSEAYNLDLSQRRAGAVAAALQADIRLDGSPIAAHGLGELQPAAPNTNPDGSDNPTGRRLNRRVEIIVDSSGGIGPCVGIYAGSYIGGEAGVTGASLRSDGTLEVTFSPDEATPDLAGTAAVSADGTISSTSGIGLSGRIDFSTCTAAGVWEDLGLTGRWTLSR